MIVSKKIIQRIDEIKCSCTVHLIVAIHEHFIMKETLHDNNKDVGVIYISGSNLKMEFCYNHNPSVLR